MPTIKVRVSGKIAENLTPEVKIVCGNEDYKVHFEFEEPWGGANFKTGLFIYNGKLVAQPFDGNVCPMPIIENTTLLAIGVKTSDGELYTTTPAYADCLKSASDLATNKIPAPSKDVYDEIIELLNKYIANSDLTDYQKKVDENLQTESKEIVGAINELHDREDKQGLTEEQVRGIVQETAVTQENDPTVPYWAKQAEKPIYSYEEITDKPNLLNYATKEEVAEGYVAKLTSKYRVIRDITLEEDTKEVYITTDENGNTFKLKSVFIMYYGKFTADIVPELYLRFNGGQIYQMYSYMQNTSLNPEWDYRHWIKSDRYGSSNSGETIWQSIYANKLLFGSGQGLYDDNAALSSALAFIYDRSPATEIGYACVSTDCVFAKGGRIIFWGIDDDE